MVMGNRGMTDEELFESMKSRMKEEGKLSLFYNDGSLKWGNHKEIEQYAKVVRLAYNNVEDLADVCTKINPCISYEQNLSIITNMRDNIIEIHDITDVEELHKCITSVGYINKYLG